ncbi:hypothetical protein BDQ12DRAFT_612887 [Crucibulum laeve]|uniref:FAD-binding PCMH-type domain-containing protein n=1 Tax=Crucibulum laeve TaxID=68775 RepID=A0A5C3LPV7_9AGAR|nr:hypothetical protein BDQ12DRAFT_612887 [Crucibulum laeve]
MTCLASLAGLLVLGVTSRVQGYDNPFERPVSKSPDWSALNRQVGGRLSTGAPYAQPCFSSSFSSSQCTTIQNDYTDEVTRSHQRGAYIQTQWETCQATGEQCLLDYLAPNNSLPTSPPAQCRMGSIPQYFIDVQIPDDVSAAFTFSKKYRVPLVIKNTGHDYKGRSSAPGSLALWTHNLKNITYILNFKADGCSKTNSAVTVGAGIQWGEAYEFAEAHNITLVGGCDRSVGVAGGWLQGGGHGALSNTMGLGVDRALQFKVVTPDGKYRTANACQNEDLFFALRGGGGGTFGVVLEATVLASPQLSLQTVIVSFAAKNTTLTKQMWSILADNGLKWADEGWGGFSQANIAILLNPVISKEDATTSMAPLIDFGKQLQAANVTGAALVVTTFPSWGAFFQVFTGDHVAVVGSSLALASRLINKSNFDAPKDRTALVSGLLAADATAPGLIILISAPTSFAGDGQTSVTDVWRSSLYHVTVVSPWNWNATLAEKKAGYDTASKAIDNLRKITPEAAYLNESDVHEPNHEVAFWGKHYPELLRIKKKYDPDQLLDCWHCVGWNPKSTRFSCYV